MAKWARRLREVDDRAIRAVFPNLERPVRNSAAKPSRHPASPIRWLPEDSRWRHEPLKTVLEVGFPIPIVMATLFVLSGGWSAGAIAARLTFVLLVITGLVVTLVRRSRRSRGK